MRTMSTLGIACILSVSCFLVVACAQDRATITIDPARHYQVMRGWEVTLDMADVRPDPAPVDAEKIYDMAVNDVGIDRVRLEVRSGAENNSRGWQRFKSGEVTEQEWRPLRYATVNDNDDPQVINWAAFDFAELDHTVEATVLPLKRRIEARGERLFVNMCYVAFTGQITNGVYQHDDPEEYAEFVLATYLHLRDKYALTPDSWEVLLEPDNNIRQWNANLMGRAIVAAGKRLRENGFTPAFVAPSTMDMANAAPWIEEIAKVPGALEDVVELSYHRYRNSTLENAQRIGEAGARYRKPTSMLEWWFGNGNYRVLREDLTTANNASWQGQVIRTLFKVDFADPKAQKVSIAPDTRQNLQYFRYVRFGAQRVGATSDDADYTRPSAFVNRDGGLVVVTDTKSAVALSIHGAPLGTYAVSFALDDGSFGQLNPIVTGANGELLAKMPGAGVITVSAMPVTTPR